jgi:hypothetical protein
MTCEFCRKTQAEGWTDVTCEGIQYVDECPRPVDRVPKLSLGNIPLWELFGTMAPFLQNGMGGYNSHAVEQSLNLYVDPDVRPEAMDRILALIEAHKEVMDQRRQK